MYILSFSCCHIKGTYLLLRGTILYEYSAWICVIRLYANFVFHSRIKGGNFKIYVLPEKSLSWLRTDKELRRFLSKNDILYGWELFMLKTSIGSSFICLYVCELGYLYELYVFTKLSQITYRLITKKNTSKHTPFILIILATSVPCHQSVTYFFVILCFYCIFCHFPMFFYNFLAL